MPKTRIDPEKATGQKWDARQKKMGPEDQNWVPRSKTGQPDKKRPLRLEMSPDD